jgi:hypothetical protein
VECVLRAAQKVIAMVMAIITPNTLKVIHLNSSATAPVPAKAALLLHKAASVTAHLFSIVMLMLLVFR